MDKNVKIFPWIAAFDTGLPEIDEQHKQLVALLNQLANHLAYKIKSPTIDEVFNKMAQYAVYHFDTEEAVWQQYFVDDEWNKDHRASHSRFMADVGKIKANQNMASYEKIMEEVIVFLTHWLAFHIIESDKVMATVVLAIQQGSSFDEAKRQANANARLNATIKASIKSVLGLHAENEYVKMRIIRYLTIAKEDGGMTLTGLQRLAKSVGVEKVEGIHLKKELIRAIQKATNDDPCFRYKPFTICSEEDCIWKAECKKMIAIWAHHLE